MAQSISTKSQVWSLDLIVSIVIFLTALVLFYKYSINLADIEKKDLNDLLLDGKLISSYLVSPGYPSNWEDNPNDATLIGLTNGNMDINPKKVEEFSGLSYNTGRRLLSTTHDYYIFFEDNNNNSISIRGIDGIGGDYVAENPEDMIQILRFVYYNQTIIRMVLYVW